MSGSKADPLDVELRRQTANIVSLERQGTSGRTPTNWPTSMPRSSRAQPKLDELMAPFSAYSRGWGERFGRITKDEEIDGLGDEAWLLRTETNGTEVTYHWRRGNLVVEAHVHCFGFCQGDVGAAARTWVDAIDKAARARS